MKDVSRNFRSVKEHAAERDFTNRKPYRTAAQKAEARRTARKVEGRWVSSAPITRHGVGR